MAAHAAMRCSIFSNFGQFGYHSSLFQWTSNNSKVLLRNLATLRVFQPAVLGGVIYKCRIHTQNGPCYQVPTQGPAIPGLGNSYSFSTIKYPLTIGQYKSLSSPGNKTVNLVMNRSHALIRIPPQSIMKNSIGIMIGGSQDQIKMAKQLLEYYLKGPSDERKKVDRSETGTETTTFTGEQKLLWEGYIRNFKGQIPPEKTRKKCIRGKHIGTGNPCPICKFFIEDPAHNMLSKVDYQDVKLIKQFISPQSGQIIDFKITGLCQGRHKEVIAAIEKAKEYGLIPFTIPGPRDEPKPFKFAGVPYKVRHKT